MTIAFIVTLVFLALVAGYAARQMQDIQEKDATIEGLRGQVEDMRGKPSVIEEQAHEIENLTSENATLRQENANLSRLNRDHESNLEMVLDKLGDDAE